MVSGTAHTRRLPAATTQPSKCQAIGMRPDLSLDHQGNFNLLMKNTDHAKSNTIKELNVYIIFNTLWCKNGNGSVPLLLYIFPSVWYSEEQEAPRHHGQEGKGNSTEERRAFSPQRRKVYTFTRARATPPPPPPLEHSVHSREHTSDRICSTFTSIVSLLPAVCTPPLIRWPRADYPKDIVYT